ncbi:MAG TPA: hypothetical protein ENJ08_12715 [Gammaproteobacteria bacterium]|nr:hypothetical protein [Gammaproteobacteria bacterium]
MNLEKLSYEWIKAVDAHEASPGDDEGAIDYIMDLAYDENFDELWAFIKYTYKLEINDKVAGVLAAGPLEDLLAKKGEFYINEIETLSRQDPKFKDLLGGVWQNEMSESLWQRVCKTRGVPW